MIDSRKLSEAGWRAYKVRHGLGTIGLVSQVGHDELARAMAEDQAEGTAGEDQDGEGVEDVEPPDVVDCLAMDGESWAQWKRRHGL